MDPLTPLPPRPVRVKGADHTMLFFLLVVAVVVLIGYVYVSKPAETPAPEAVAQPVAVPTRPPLSPEEEAEEMKACQFRGVQHGTCMVDPSSNKVYAKCDNGYYGPNCSKKCVTGGTKLTVYTPGFEADSPAAATCVCPATSHFQNADPQSGCQLSSEMGELCESGWHGAKCDQQGDFTSCGPHGTQGSDGKCRCTGGYAGANCEYASDWCSKKDKGATMDSSFKCVCSATYTGTRCQTPAAGYVETATGPAKCQNNGTVVDGKCKCTPPWAGELCQYQLDTCKKGSGPGCKPDGSKCKDAGGAGNWFSSKGEGCNKCDDCCGTGKATGCGANQTPRCSDNNSYPCVTSNDSNGHYMKSGGKEMSGSEVNLYVGPG